MRKIETHDGWDIPEERAAFQTEVSLEYARSIISYNSSPDLGFDRSVNPYRGCEHGCIYCFARPTHAFLGLSPGLDFETKLIARPNAAERLEHSLRKPGYSVAPIAIGTNTDPYQPVEKSQHLMRDCLEVLQAFRHPVTILTKGTLIERDIDILAEMASDGLVSVGISITTLDLRLSRLLEPRVPSPQRRLATIEKLTHAGIPVRLMMAPVVPGLTDHEVERILGAACSAGALAANWIMLRLPLEVAPLFKDWLDEHFPDRKEKVMSRLREMHGGKDYDASFERRMRGEGPYAQMIAHRIGLAMRRLGLSRDLPPLQTGLFQAPIAQGDQLSLF